MCTEFHLGIIHIFFCRNTIILKIYSFLKKLLQYFTPNLKNEGFVQNI